ncbi:ABC transporter substrate-binding protein [Longispora albida]|uniref:ABC transporter substrate-binding protein n=1 Tax=Longispora albida TaxID=203523 RepID=UPI0003787208|nr:sugar ABC transporter substrate-binding protein [Longispora albida]
MGSHKHRTRIRLIAALATTALALAGCGLGGEKKDGGTPIGGEVKGEVSFLTLSLKPKFTDYIQGMIDDFQKKYPGTTVKWIDLPPDGYQQKILADAAAGTLPDVVNIGADNALPMSRQGLLVNIAEAMPKAKDDYTAGSWKAYEIPGKGGSYGFPWYLTTGGNFVNKSLLQQAGMSGEQVPKTFTEFKEFGMKISQNSGGKIWALSAKPGLVDLALHGVKVMNDEGTKFTFNTPEGVKALQDYVDLFKAGAMPPDALTRDGAKSNTDFLAGKIALVPGSASFLTEIKQNAPSLYPNVAIAPQLTNTGHSNMYILGLSVNAKSKNKRTALEFGHFVTNPENQAKFAKIVTIFPSTPKSYEDPFFSTPRADKNADEEKYRIEMSKQIKEAVSYTPAQFSDRMSKVFDREVGLAMLGQKSAKEALDTAAEDCNKLLAG